MTAFVEECRQEWKRLGVPDRLAEEMAAELRPRARAAEEAAAHLAMDRRRALPRPLRGLVGTPNRWAQFSDPRPAGEGHADAGVSVPKVIGMKACKAVRSVARSGIDDWRIAKHEHGYSCDLIVVGQTPVGRAIRRPGHPMIVTLRLGRS